MLTTIAQLTETTAELFGRAFREAEGPINLCGIWTTGEWLFHDEGWAWSTIGSSLIELLRNGQLKMSLVFAKSPIEKTERLNRGLAVMKRLSEFSQQDCCEIDHLDWWKLNRGLTLLCWRRAGGGNRTEAGGIYMRRRLATPLVAPVRVSGNDCVVLREIFLRYQERARRGSSRPTVESAVIAN